MPIPFDDTESDNSTEQTSLLSNNSSETTNKTNVNLDATPGSCSPCFPATNARAYMTSNRGSMNTVNGMNMNTNMNIPQQVNNGGVNFSTNTLLVYRLQDMRSLSNSNLFLAVLCLIYMGINVTLVCVNYVNDRYMAHHTYAEEAFEPVDDTVYHLVEFWATFCFAVVECVALAVTPKSQYNINGGMDPLFLKFVMFVNIVATSVPAVMISFSIETFERASHEIEYINEVTMSFVDVILLLSLWKSKSSRSSGNSYNNYSYNMNNNTDESSATWQGVTTTLIALLVALVQLGVYNLMGYDEERHDMIGEVPAHFLEFSFEIVSALIAFWFCMDNKFVADKEIGMILFGTHQEDCQICNNQVTEFARNNGARTSMAATGIPPEATICKEAYPPQIPPMAAASTYYQSV